MIKRCKVTKIINPPIRGVIDKPIKEGNIVYMHEGQIRACLGIATVDELLPSGAVVRLNLDNYKLDNSADSKQITIEDAVPVTSKVKVEEVKEVSIPEPIKEEAKVEAPVEVEETPVTSEEEVTVDKNDDITDESKVESTEEATTEEPKENPPSKKKRK